MRRDLQGALHEWPDLRHALKLIEVAHRRVGPASVVAEVQPVIALPLDVDPGRQPMVQAPERHGPTDAPADAVGQPVEIDVCKRGRVPEAADDAEQRQRCLAAGREPPLQRRAGLALRDILPRDEGEIARRRGVGVPAHFGRGERARVVRAGIPADVRRRRERPALREREVPARVEIAEIGGRVLPLAGVVEP